MAAAAKFRLKAAPTFRKVVQVPVPGGGKVDLDATFRHFTRAQLLEWTEQEASAKRSDVQSLADIMVDWHNVEEPFGTEALGMLVDNYHTGAVIAIVRQWSAELVAQRLGN